MVTRRWFVVMLAGLVVTALGFATGYVIANSNRPVTGERSVTIETVNATTSAQETIPTLGMFRGVPSLPRRKRTVTQTTGPSTTTGPQPTQTTPPVRTYTVPTGTTPRTTTPPSTTQPSQTTSGGTD